MHKSIFSAYKLRLFWLYFFVIFIRSADPQSRLVVIIIFAHVVRPFVRPSVRPSPLFKSSTTKQQKIMVATGETVGLAEWIIDDTCLVILSFLCGLTQVD